MASAATPTSSHGTAFYIMLGLLILPALALLYFVLSYLAINLFLTLDLSAYGQLAAGGWPGYTLLGLGLGAAGGMIAAQQRFRLHRGLLLGAGLLVLSLGLLAAATLPNAKDPIEEAANKVQPYQSIKKRVTCGACMTIEATNTRSTQNDNTYEASNLLSRDTTKAWISEVAIDARNPLLADTQLYLTIAPLAGHRLAGLRVRNGYCKNNGVYHGFSRVQTCKIQLAANQSHVWKLPDAQHKEFFIPIQAPTSDTTKLTFTVINSYPGDEHAEAALAWLVPVFEPLAL